MEKEPTSKIQFLAKPSALCSVFGITSDLWRYRFGSLGVSVSVTNLRTFGPIILGGKFSQKTFFSSYFLKKPATQPGSLWAWYRFEGAWPKMLHESPFFFGPVFHNWAVGNVRNGFRTSMGSTVPGGPTNSMGTNYVNCADIQPNHPLFQPL